jgi:hypothetical protein
MIAVGHAMAATRPSRSAGAAAGCCPTSRGSFKKIRQRMSEARERPRVDKIELSQIRQRNERSLSKSGSA